MILMFSFVFVGGALFATITLQFTAGMEFTVAIATVLRRVAKSVAFRQLLVISAAILVLRYGMNNFLMTLSKFSSSPVQWDKTKLFYILREVYQPLELLLFIAALCTVSDAYVPSLIGVPKATVQHVVKSILSTSFILGFASVVFNLKSRFCKENAWQAEMKGDVTTQRRWEAYDKLGTFVIYVMSFVLGIQALGLEVTSVLAIGGIGGLAIGLAGREICENLLNGFLIMSTNPFEVGDEITFFHNNKVVEGFVIDIGWYRTNVRSFEREVYVIPNAVFSKNIVLNVSRKNREWRFYEMLSIRVQDVPKANAIVQDIRRIVRNDTRVINKLHRRVFLDKISPDDAKIYMSFYLEAANRDAFMAIKQDLLVSFVDCVERNGAKLATPRTVVDMDPEVADMINSITPLVQGMGAYALAHNIQQAPGNVPQSNGPIVPQQPQQQWTQLLQPPTINTEVTTVPMSGAGPQGGGMSSSPSPPGTPGASTPGVDKQQPGVTPVSPPPPPPMPKPAVSVLSGLGTTPPGQSMPPPAPPSGTKVGDVYTAPQSTVVVSVPATGVPVAFAGAVTSNNVVSASTGAGPAGPSVRSGVGLSSGVGNSNQGPGSPGPSGGPTGAGNGGSPLPGSAPGSAASVAQTASVNAASSLAREGRETGMSNKKVGKEKLAALSLDAAAAAATAGTAAAVTAAAAPAAAVAATAVSLAAGAAAVTAAAVSKVAGEVASFEPTPSPAVDTLADAGNTTPSPTTAQQAVAAHMDMQPSASNLQKRATVPTPARPPVAVAVNHKRPAVDCSEQTDTASSNSTNIGHSGTKVKVSPATASMELAACLDPLASDDDDHDGKGGSMRSTTPLSVSEAPKQQLTDIAKDDQGRCEGFQLPLFEAASSMGSVPQDSTLGVPSSPPSTTTPGTPRPVVGRAREPVSVDMPPPVAAKDHEAASQSADVDQQKRSAAAGVVQGDGDTDASEDSVDGSGLPMPALAGGGKAGRAGASSPLGASPQGPSSRWPRVAASRVISPGPSRAGTPVEGNDLMVKAVFKDL